MRNDAPINMSTATDTTVDNRDFILSVRGDYEN